ncbi:hypothetical protein SOCEGT47_003620 [Sorangium cellulosum]|uniref:Cytochrome C Planctomycete-type domain-containing protein n=1 Tax=Sorangium cellulosum TaxID=56 RepID=A0A4P2PTN0_SORCE|nr:hypothetical protein [Sorangium cellulosum]AUX19908.1 hypothetical protein SOCEGT47_003620 [Sorangium cellulosum]
MRRFLLVSLMAVASAGAACGGDDGDGTPAATECFDYARFDATTPEVSFRTDVLPVFQRSCAFSATCHGAVAGSAGFTFLGPGVGAEITDEELAELAAQNVGAPSRAPSGMPRITAGDPARSFLMHKVDGTLSCGDLECTPETCGAPMPYSGSTLPAAERDAIRRWIAQGAEVP